MARDMLTEDELRGKIKPYAISLVDSENISGYVKSLLITTTTNLYIERLTKDLDLKIKEVGIYKRRDDELVDFGRIRLYGKHEYHSKRKIKIIKNDLSQEYGSNVMILSNGEKRAYMRKKREERLKSYSPLIYVRNKEEWALIREKRRIRLTCSLSSLIFLEQGLAFLKIFPSIFHSRVRIISFSSVLPLSF